MTNKVKIENLSQHLFWDIDVGKLDFKRDRKFIIQRVLDYGLITDWRIISNYYGISEISKTAIGSIFFDGSKV